MPNVLRQPLTPLLLFSATLLALLVGYALRGTAPSPEFEFVSISIWAVLLAMWVVADARQRRMIPCFDFGFLCYTLLGIAVPSYCLWSRGWRGMGTVALLLALLLVPFLIADAVAKSR